VSPSNNLARRACPEWNPTISAETPAWGYPSLTLQNSPNVFPDGICEIALSENCRQYTKFPRFDNVFAKNIRRNLDFTHYGGRIIAYRIRWFSGSWSNWFVPGINDIGPKYWTAGGQKYLMRWWAYFSDHTHSFILCK
jgi:hypothetical protein